MDPQNSAGGVPAGNPKSSKKTMYIVIAVVVIIIIGWFAMRGTRSIAPGIDANRNIDGSQTFSNGEGTVTVGSNKLPDTWPADAPKYPNGTIQYSGSSDPQTGEAGAAVMFTTSDNVTKVIDFYKKELVSNGWTIEQTVTSGPSTVLAAKKDTRTFGVYITDAGNGQVSVTASVTIPK